jgi:hypothetical protein
MNVEFSCFSPSSSFFPNNKGPVINYRGGAGGWWKKRAGGQVFLHMIGQYDSYWLHCIRNLNYECAFCCLHGGGGVKYNCVILKGGPTKF